MIMWSFLSTKTPALSTKTPALSTKTPVFSLHKKLQNMVSINYHKKLTITTEN